jgi:hypothetical protein
MSALDVQVQKVEHDSMGEVTEAAIVDAYSLPGVDHLHFS